MEEMKLILGRLDKELEQLMSRGKKCIKAMESWVPKDLVKNKESI